MAELAILGMYVVYGSLYILREKIIARHMTPTREK
jgi:hypothetical protein